MPPNNQSTNCAIQGFSARIVPESWLFTFGLAVLPALSPAPEDFRFAGGMRTHSRQQKLQGPTRSPLERSTTSCEH